MLFKRVIRSLSLLALSIAVAIPSHAQSTPAKPASGGTSANPDGSANLGFSIESEMLTYRALESNSEAVACDISAYLTGGVAEFANSPKNTVCTVKGGAATASGVVIMPFTGASIIEGFRLWRAEMEIMDDLNFRVGEYCPDLNPAAFHRGSGTSTAVSSALSLTPAGSAISVAQSAIGLFAQETTNMPVGGTIHDEAFMDGVARELRRLGINVLMPTLYMPSSFTAAHVSQSPFLNRLDKLLLGNICLQDIESKSDTSSLAKANIKQIVADITAYMDTLRASAPKIAPNQAGTLPRAPDAGTAGTGNTPGTTPGTTPTVQAAVTAAAPSSSLLSILAADDLAQKLDTDSLTGVADSKSKWKHILMLKALESGGTVEHQANILGVKVRYSGGAVGTYSLFSLDGEVMCSGNVYAYGGSVPSKTFQAGLQNFLPDPSNQFIFHKGSCRPR